MINNPIGKLFKYKLCCDYSTFSDWDIQTNSIGTRMVTIDTEDIYMYCGYCESKEINILYSVSKNFYTYWNSDTNFFLKIFEEI